MMPNVSACSSCGRTIIWVLSPAGRAMPLTAKPVTIYELDEGGPDDRHSTDAIKADGGPYYISHFVDCPTREEHKR